MASDGDEPVGSPASEPPAQIHDSLFRLTYGRPEHAASHLRQLLPAALVARVDWSSLTPLDGTFVDPEFQRKTSDLLCAARFTGGDLLVYFLFEHQSTVDPSMPLRFAGSATRALEAYRRQHSKGPLPLLVPVLVHHSRTGWNAACSLEEMYGLDEAMLAAVRPYTLQLAFLVEDISAEHGEALRRRVGLTPLVRLTLFVLARARESSDIEGELAEWADELEALLQGPQGLADAVMILRYTAEVGRIDLDRLRSRFRGRPAEQAVMSTAKQLIEQGREEGLEQGLLRGSAKTLVRLLTLRFGALTDAQLARVHAASAADLDAMTEKVVFAASLADVFGEA